MEELTVKRNAPIHANRANTQTTVGAWYGGSCTPESSPGARDHVTARTARVSENRRTDDRVLRVWMPAAATADGEGGGQTLWKECQKGLLAGETWRRAGKPRNAPAVEQLNVPVGSRSPR